ncbi:RNA methyltransferase, TrmH family [Seinonella peptonophila]|uniref:RNA methyltransferase, TrmH family n=1 Tax=Seinonella peptonophila TaxID=112248 RepID=A0A1M4U655_9BACL|nr:RNA methyltransferase [Seinonella peptonophila]SHE52123.1 RNA methyltransferase, TrmH family [Seinonella peptonophila]
MNNPNYISSKQNERIKNWRKLRTRKGRQQFGSFIIEGEKLVLEAVRSNMNFRSLILSTDQSSWLEQNKHLFSDELSIYLLESPLFRTIVETEHPQGMAAEVDLPVETSISQRIPRQQETHILLDRIQDPGNLGAIFRTVEALGGDYIWLSEGCVDPLNPKVVRSAMGSLFRVPYAHVEMTDCISYLEQQGVTIYLTSPYAAERVESIQLPSRVGFLLGNESEGVANEFVKRNLRQVSITMSGEAESLNVSMTAGLLLYERRRSFIN